MGSVDLIEGQTPSEWARIRAMTKEQRAEIYQKLTGGKPWHELTAMGRHNAAAYAPHLDAEPRPLKRIRFSTWWRDFKPVVNHLRNCRHSFGPMCGMGDGTDRQHAFETFGPDLDHVLAFANNQMLRGKVWTVLDCDGRLIVGNGYHFVNRECYFLTIEKADPETDYEIIGV